MNKLLFNLQKAQKGSVTQDMNELCLMLLQLSNTFLYFPNNSENSVNNFFIYCLNRKKPNKKILNFKQLFGTVLISIMRLMDASHYDLLFEWSSSVANSIENLIQYNLSLIDHKINKFIIEKKQITYDNSVSQLVIVKLIYTCKTLLESSTFPKDWSDLLILRNK